MLQFLKNLEIFFFSTDDRKTSTRVSAEVKFHNLAGKNILISAKPDVESIAKEIELKPGSRGTLRIDESSMDEPVIFSAKWVGNEKELLLNGNKTLQVKPRPTNNYSVEVDVTDPGKFFITIYLKNNNG